MTAYYSEIDPHAAQWLRNLISSGAIAPGEVDERSIADVRPEDLRGFTQCHFFAGIGVWSYALRLAGWSDSRECWTGSCPCQPFSVAGKGLGADDPRHLWPHFHRLIAACRPPIVLGEQVSGKAGEAWFDGVAADLEGAGYACEAFDIPALAVNAPHIRQRLYWRAVADAPSRDAIAERIQRSGVDGLLPQGGRDRGAAGDAEWSSDLLADADRERQPQRAERDGEPQQPGQPASRWDNALRRCDGVADADRRGRSGRAQEPQRGEERRAAAERAGDALGAGLEGHAGHVDDGRESRRFDAHAPRPAPAAGGGFWDVCEWRTGADKRARRTFPGARLLVDGSAFRVDSGGPYAGKSRVQILKGLGNAIVAPLAAEFVAAVIDSLDD